MPIQLPNSDQPLTRESLIKKILDELVNSFNDNVVVRELGHEHKDTSIQFLFGNHALTEPVYEVIKELGIDKILGEFDPNLLYLLIHNPESYYSEVDIVARITNPESGFVGEEGVVHTRILREIIKKGEISIGITDSDFDPFLQYMSRPPNLISVLGSFLIGMSLATSGYSILKGSKDEKISRRSSLVMLGLVLGVSFVFLDSVLSEGPKGVTGKMPLKEISDKIQITYEEALQTFGFTKNDFTTFFETIVILRNKVMSLNSWVLINNYEAKKIGFFAGNGHSEAENDINNGISKLVEEVRVYARRLVYDVLENIIEANKEDLNNPEVEIEALRAILTFGALFSCPFQIGSQLPRHDQEKFIPSAQNILMEEIDKIIKSLPGVNNFKTRVLSESKRALMELTSARIGYTRSVVNNIRENTPKSIELPEEDRVQIFKSIKLFRNIDELGREKQESIIPQTIIFQTYPIAFEQGLQGTIVGYVESGNEVLPVMRQYRINEDYSKVEVWDSMIYTNGDKVLLNEYTYKKVSPQEIEPSFADTFTSLKLSPIQANIVPELEVHTANDAIPVEPNDIYFVPEVEGSDTLLKTQIIIVPGA